MIKSSLERAIYEADNVSAQLRGAAEYPIGSKARGQCIIAARRRARALIEDLDEVINEHGAYEAPPSAVNE